MAHVSSSSSTSIDELEVLYHQLFIVTKVHLMKNWNFNQLHNRLIGIQIRKSKIYLNEVVLKIECRNMP